MIDLLISAKGDSPITLEALFPTSPERLFRAWTAEDELQAWFGRDPSLTDFVKIDLRVGGAWKIALTGGTDHLEGIYVQIVPNERLRFTWAHVQTSGSSQVRTPPSEVTLDFAAVGQATRLTLTHKDISTEGGRIGVRDGWQNSFHALAQLVSGN